MTSARTYEFLTRVFADRIMSYDGIEETLKYAKGNRKPSKGVTAYLSDAVETQVYRSKEKYILVNADGNLFAYNGQWWERIDQPNFMRELIKRVLAEIGVSVTYRTYSVDKIASECMSGLVASDECLFTPNRRYITFTNGVFDLRTGELKDFHLRYTTDITLDFPFMADRDGYLNTNPEQEKFRLWDRKIAEIFDNREFRDAFQMFCGSLLADRASMKVEYICYLEGPGANGKSVAAQAVANVFGEKYFGKYSPAQLLRGSQKEYYMADLKGKLCNLCDDLDERTLSGGEFKRIISGEAVQAREPYARKPIKVVAPLFICCTNSMPQTKDDTWGHHRRQLRLLTTRKRFGEDREKDPRLTAKLMEIPCRQRIFNWIYQGYRKVVAKGGEIELSPEVKKAMESLMEESTPMRMWAKERGYSKKKDERTGTPQWVKLAVLFADYRNWCRDNGVADPGDSRVLSAFLRNLDYENKSFRDGLYFLIYTTEDN